MSKESDIRITFNCKEPSRLLPTSAKRAVAVHETATLTERISPKYCILLVYWAQSYNKIDHRIRNIIQSGSIQKSLTCENKLLATHDIY